MEMQVVGVERIKEYINNESEADWKTTFLNDSIRQQNNPVQTYNVTSPEQQHFSLTDWPSVGQIEFDQFCFRYKADAPLVLKRLNFIILSGERIGIVGRTGAGKTSLTLALFRLVEPDSGRILIDGVDISRVGLHELRKSLTIIPQVKNFFILLF